MNAHMKHANLRRRMHDIAEQREILRRCAIPFNRHPPSWYRRGRHHMRHTARQWQHFGGFVSYGRVGFGRDQLYRVDA